ncbi:MAG: DUF6276 family protein [Euryarchaeota archaeon]|nr:DUF6276 family protein [Euryarchaeota archaeon]
MPSQCPRCEGPRFTVDVPAELTTYTDGSALDCCPRCLSVAPGDSATIDPEPPFETVIRRFPTGTEGVALFLLLDRLDSLALNRSEIESLVDRLESNGVDLFLTLDRLLDAPDIQPSYDLARRRDQLEALLD